MCKLEALDALNAAGMTGTDATTSLDSFIRRAAQQLAADTSQLSTADRHSYLVGTLGSDAVRAASVLIKSVSA